MFFVFGVSISESGFLNFGFWILDCFLFLVTVVIVSGAAALPRGGVDLPKREYVPTKTTITTKVGLESFFLILESGFLREFCILDLGFVGYRIFYFGILAFAS